MFSNGELAGYYGPRIAALLAFVFFAGAAATSCVQYVRNNVSVNVDVEWVDDGEGAE